MRGRCPLLPPCSRGSGARGQEKGLEENPRTFSFGELDHYLEILLSGL